MGFGVVGSLTVLLYEARNKILAGDLVSAAMGRGCGWSAADVALVEQWLAAGYSASGIFALRPDWPWSSVKKLVRKLRRGEPLRKPGSACSKLCSSLCFSVKCEWVGCVAVLAWFWNEAVGGCQQGDASEG